VSAVVGDGFAEVRWTPPADPGSGPVTGFLVTMHQAVSSSRYRQGRLRASFRPCLRHLYQFTVAAVGGRAGSGPAHSPPNAVTLLSPPSAPQTVSAVACQWQPATVTCERACRRRRQPDPRLCREPLPDGHR